MFMKVIQMMKKIKKIKMKVINRVTIINQFIVMLSKAKDNLVKMHKD